MLRLVLPAFLIGPLLLAMFGSVPAGANVMPESAILVHVQPADLPQPSCDTPITDCRQVVRSLPDLGLMEFQLFVYPIAYEQDHLPISALETDLVWPPSWHLADAAICNNGSGSLEGQRLSIRWDCPVISGQIFLAATLIFDANVPGRLDFQNKYQSPIWLGCYPDGFAVDAMGFFAEVGATCEYTRYSCAYGGFCTPTSFHPPQLLLTAPTGGNAQGDVSFQAISGFGEECVFGLDPGAPWATATVRLEQGFDYVLTVMADASGLDPGSYETWVQLRAGQDIARCLQVRFDVQENTGVGMPGSQVRLDTWGHIKTRYRD